MSETKPTAAYSSRKILIATILAAIVLMVLIVPGTANRPVASTTDGDVDTRIQPVGRFEMAKAAPVSDGKPKDGATVYASVCSACHASGAAGAPKSGDKAAWGPRIAQGKDALYKSAISGKNGMPPKGGAAALSDAEIKGAVDHLVGLAK